MSEKVWVKMARESSVVRGGGHLPRTYPPIPPILLLSVKGCVACERAAGTEVTWSVPPWDPETFAHHYVEHRCIAGLGESILPGLVSWIQELDVDI